MYNKIVVNRSSEVVLTTSMKLTTFMNFVLDNDTTLYWYLSQIIFIDPYCKTKISSNYTNSYSLRKHLNYSTKMMKYVAYNCKYNFQVHINHVWMVKSII